MITWDFDIIKGDVIFTVFRHKRPKEACSGSLTNLGDGSSCGVIANVDAVVVERPKTCHDGDSIQVGGGLVFDTSIEVQCTHIKISQLLASLSTIRQQVVFALLS